MQEVKKKNLKLNAHLLECMRYLLTIQEQKKTTTNFSYNNTLASDKNQFNNVNNKSF